MNTKPFKDHEQIIQDKWKDRMCPIVNGITFGNGMIFRLEFQDLEFDDNISPLQVTERMDVELFTGKFGDYWTTLTSLCEFRLPQRNLLVYGGEGGFGADGFVALSRISDDYLNWLAFFDDSNPFVEVSINDESVLIGITTLGDVWQFPLDHPESVKVIRIKQ